MAHVVIKLASRALQDRFHQDIIRSAVTTNGSGATIQGAGFLFLRCDGPGNGFGAAIYSRNC
jgi:hypothetical protein